MSFLSQRQRAPLAQLEAEPVLLGTARAYIDRRSLPAKVVGPEADKISAMVAEEATELWGAWVGVPEVGILRDVAMLATQVVRVPTFTDVLPFAL